MNTNSKPDLRRLTQARSVKSMNDLIERYEKTGRLEYKDRILLYKHTKVWIKDNENH